MYQKFDQNSIINRRFFLRIMSDLPINTNAFVVLSLKPRNGCKVWKDYRFQADVFYMYHIMKTHGFDDDHISLWAFNDMVNNSLNPYKGQMFHLLDNKNIYPGDDKLDFQGPAVNRLDFLQYLRNLNTTKDDNIFFYFNDHGSPNILYLPYGQFLTSYEVLRVIKQMQKDGKFNKMFFAIEACFSGCFKESYNNIPNVAIMTAANCSTTSKSYLNCLLGTSLSNEFSINLMMEIEGNPKHTLRSLHEIVREKVHNSTPLLFGQNLDDPLSDYIGEGPKSSLRRQSYEDLSLDDKILHPEKYTKKEIAEKYQKQLKHMKQVAEDNEIFIRRVVEKVAGPRASEFMNKVITGDVRQCFEPVIEALFAKMKEFNPDYVYLISPIKTLCTKYSSSAIIDAINSV